MIRHATSLLLVLLACLALAACGGDGGSDDSSSSSGGDAGRLEHVDGTLALDGERLTVDSTGGEALTFGLGPEVEPASVRALEASETTARITYREEGGERTAVTVAAAPKIAEGVETYEGIVVEVDATHIEIDGADGARTFSISAEHRPSFDVAHLREHAKEGEPVRVYFRSGASGDAAVAYEDS